MKKLKVRVGTAERFRKAGKVPILLGVYPEDRELIKTAAKIEKRSMAQFIIFNIVDLARRLVKEEND